MDDVNPVINKREFGEKRFLMILMAFKKELYWYLAIYDR